MYPNSLFKKYKTKGALFDTNLLLLLAIGRYDIHRIQKFKRTQKYTQNDYTLLIKLAEYFDRRVTTPNILTEVDNLARQLPREEHNAISVVLLELVKNMFEIYIESGQIIQTDLYPILGLTDAAIMRAPEELLVLTDDFVLSNRLSSRGRDVININHIRKLI